MTEDETPQQRQDRMHAEVLGALNRIEAKIPEPPSQAIKIIGSIFVALMLLAFVCVSHHIVSKNPALQVDMKAK